MSEKNFSVQVIINVKHSSLKGWPQIVYINETIRHLSVNAIYLSAKYNVSKITVTCCYVVFSEGLLVVHVFILYPTEADLIQTANEACWTFNVSVHLV